MSPADTPFPTTMQEARVLLNRILIAIARHRGVSAEVADFETREQYERFQSFLTPWISGPKSLIPLLERLTDAGGTPSPSDVNNILTIATMLEPTIAAAYGLRWDEDLPDVDHSVHEWKGDAD